MPRCRERTTGVLARRLEEMKRRNMTAEGKEEKGVAGGKETRCGPGLAAASKRKIKPQASSVCVCVQDGVSLGSVGSVADS